MSSKPAPPRLLIAALEVCLPADLGPCVAGDLIEEFTERARLRPLAARSWLYRQVLASLPPLLLLRVRRVDARVSAAAAIGALGGSLLASCGFSALWSRLLYLVPLRAGHAPGAGWIVFAAGLAAAAALLGALAAACVARLTLQEGERR